MSHIWLIEFLPLSSFTGNFRKIEHVSSYSRCLSCHVVDLYAFLY